MTDHKFTDEEVIKALRCLLSTNDTYDDCPYCDDCGDCVDCVGKALHDALDLINRQKAEIERLDTIVNPKEHGVSFFVMINEAKERFEAYKQQLKAEAIKEFAQRLKEKLIANGIYPVLVKNSIDKLLKEMTEGN